MVEPRDEAGAVEALDRYWEGLLGHGPQVRSGALREVGSDGFAPTGDGPGGGAPGRDGPVGEEPGMAATVRRVHALPDAPGPSAAFAARLEEELMAAHPGSMPATVAARPARLGAVPGSGSTASIRSGNGVAPGGWWAAVPAASPRRARRRPWWGRALEGLAAAVLVLAIAAGTIVGLGRLPGRDGGPVAAPAIAQATPGAAVVPGAAMERGNAGRTGEVTGPGPIREPELAWEAAIEGATHGFGGPPVVVDGVAYFGGVRWSDDGESAAEAGLVIALDAASGADRWRAEVVSADGTDAPPGAPDGTAPSVFVNEPAVVEGTVFVGTVVDTPVGEKTVRDARTGDEYREIETETDGAVVALDAATGAVRWRAGTGGGGWIAPAVADGVVYVPTEGAVLALDAATGAVRWRSEAPVTALMPEEEPWAGPVAVGGGLVYATSNGRVLRALDAASGAERWRLAADGDGWVGDPVVADGAVYVWSDAGAEARAEADATEAPPNVLRALDAATGAERWSYEGVGGPPTVGGGLVVLSADAGNGVGIVALDAATGRERWSTAVEGYGGDIPVLAGGALYFGTFEDGVGLLGPIADFLGIGDRNYLYALDAATGEQVWRVETPAASSAPAVADGTVFVVAVGQDGEELRAYREG